MERKIKKKKRKEKIKKKKKEERERIDSSKMRFQFVKKKNVIPYYFFPEIFKIKNF